MEEAGRGRWKKFTAEAGRSSPRWVEEVERGTHTLAPDGTYVAGNRATLAPDGTYVGGTQAVLTPDGTYVGDYGGQEN